jgi:hypothetical protein
MCYEEGRLMEYLDGEVEPGERAEMASHLRECDGCAASLAGLEADRQAAGRALSKLVPDGEADVAVAAGGGSADAPARARSGMSGLVGRVGWQRLAAAAAVVVLASSLTLAPVRNAVADLLKVFRVQKIQVVSMTTEDLQNIGDALQKGQGHIALKSMGDVWVTGPKSKATTVTLAEAQAALDFPVRLPTAIKGIPKLKLSSGQTYQFKLKVAAINEMLKYYGSESMLPDAVDGKVFSAKIPAILVATYGGSTPDPGSGPSGLRTSSLDERAIFVGQARSPELVVPEGVDPAKLRDVLLNLPFLPDKVREQLTAVNDWQSTLLVPDIGGAAHDVTIDGVPAVVMDRPSGPRLKQPGFTVPEWVTVVWSKDGVVHAVGGAMNEATAIGMAKSMMR